MTDRERKPEHDSHDSDRDKIEYRTRCHPEALGRQPLPGEHAFIIKFPLEDGSDLIVEMGRSGYDILCQMIAQMASDDAHDQLRENAEDSLREAVRMAPWSSRAVCPPEN